MSKKEEDDLKLSVQLRQEGIITTLGIPFEESGKTEIDSLVNSEVFEFILYDPQKHNKRDIFRTRLVNEIKGKGTAPYEKSRLVVQGFGDIGKKEILTQSPTIQRMSQRFILVIGPSLIKFFYVRGELRDITQAYPQAKEKLWRQIFARLPKQIAHLFLPNTILHIKKALYGLAESGLY